jgi:hypothetical protein
MDLTPHRSRFTRYKTCIALDHNRSISYKTSIALDQSISQIYCLVAPDPSLCISTYRHYILCICTYHHHCIYFAASIELRPSHDRSSRRARLKAEDEALISYVCMCCWARLKAEDEALIFRAEDEASYQSSCSNAPTTRAPRLRSQRKTLSRHPTRAYQSKVGSGERARALG